jgi:hypothetical protein
MSYFEASSPVSTTLFSQREPLALAASHLFDDPAAARSPNDPSLRCDHAFPSCHTENRERSVVA